MKTLAISVKERQNVGKSNTRALRNQGNVPCVLYGGEKQVTFYAHENDFRKLVYTPDTFIAELNIDGSNDRDKGFSFNMSNDTPFIDMSIQRATPTEEFEKVTGRQLTDEEIH